MGANQVRNVGNVVFLVNLDGTGEIAGVIDNGLDAAYSTAEVEQLRGPFVVGSADFDVGERSQGVAQAPPVQGSNTDFLICAAADRERMPILTTDKDFPLFAEHIPVQLHEPRQGLTRDG